MFFTEHIQDLFQIRSVENGDVFECLQRITTYERAEIVYVVFSHELMMDFQFVSNRSSNSLFFSDVPSKVGIVILRELSTFKNPLMFFLKLAELLLVTEC